uniref:helix-turn-helix domain-containing protein n=1 Tax=Microbispora sitophila TaxID=2771537 RepID=UPI00299F5F1B|nr:helix-turn-helix domain-containing protein [Microbispora sitophila]
MGRLSSSRHRCRPRPECRWPRPGPALERLHEPLTRADLAGHARTSVRTLTRRFHTETGLSPLQWLLHQRVIRAQELLETTDLPMEQVARLSGLATTDSLRAHLSRRTGLTPSAYRAAFTHNPRPEDRDVPADPVRTPALG